MSSRFKISAATASTSNSHVLCGSTPSSIKELYQKHKKPTIIMSEHTFLKIFLIQFFMFRL